MKKIYLKDDIRSFMEEIAAHLQDEDVEVSMYGYRAIVYRGSSMRAVVRDIQKKLRTIKNCEANIALLKNHSPLSDEEIEFMVATQSPEDIADTCLEYGLVTGSKTI